MSRLVFGMKQRKLWFEFEQPFVSLVALSANKYITHARTLEMLSQLCTKMLPQRSGPHVANISLQLPCKHPGCNLWFKTPGGRTKHRLAAHPVNSQQYRNPPLSPRPLPDSPVSPPSSGPSCQAGNENENFPDQQPHEELRMGGTLRRVFHPYLNGKVTLSLV